MRRAVLPFQEMRHELGIAGLDARTIEDRVYEAVRAERLALPEKMALGYMMSNAMETANGGSIEPHVMVYVTGYSRDDTGGIGWGLGTSTWKLGRPYVEDGWGPFVAVSFPNKEGYDPKFP